MKRIFFYTISLLSVTAAAREIVHGYPADATTTLPVVISNFIPVMNDLADGVFITAGAPGAKEFALAGYASGNSTFAPYAPENVTLNASKEKVPNPLYDAKIDLISFVINQPSAFYVVPDSANPTLYFRVGRESLASLALTDANGNPASSAVAMAGSSVSVNYVAVTPQGSTNFGDAGSAVLVTQGNGDTLILFSTTGLDSTSGVFSLATSPVIMTGGASLAWANGMSMLYLAAADLTSGGAPTDRSALVIRGSNLASFTSIVHPSFNFASLIAGTNYGIVSTGASVQGVIPFLQTMELSTAQSLIVTCGRILNGGEIPSDVHNQVYAYPLSRVYDSSTKVSTFQPGLSGFLAKKGSSDPALNASDLYTINDAPVRVGQGPLPTGVEINQLYVNGDCVYAVVSTLYPGIYMSRALFDANGLVINWTPWLRIINTQDPIYAAALNAVTGVWLTLSSDNVIANTVQRTTWQADELLTGVAQAITNLTTPAPESITALAGFDYRTPGMGNVAALVCTERNQLILAQTGFAITSNPTLYDQIPDANYTNVTTAENTELTTIVGTNPVVLIRGGLLADYAPLTTSTIVHSDTVQQTWLVTGGVGGVAIWATPAGDGWGNAFGADLSALPVGLVMQQLGEFSDVRVLYADSPFLYVVTPSQVARIDLTNGLASATVEVIATVGKNIPSTADTDVITDVLFCKELGMLATTRGVYRVEEGSSARVGVPLWELLAVPESELPIKKLNGFGPDGLPTSLDQGGDCWVLSGTARNNRSIVNRLAINSFSGAIAEDTIEPFVCDFFIRNKPSFFLDFGEYKDIVSSDGAEYLFARSIQGVQPSSIKTPNIRSYLAQPRSGNRFIGVQALPLLPSSITNALQSNADINQQLQEPATGAWYIATSKGLIVQG